MARQDRQNRDNQREESDLVDKLVGINRVAKVVKGGVVSALPHWLSSVTPKAASALVPVRRKKFLKQSARQLKVPSAT